ncbi:unnamed protein product [Amaranthus hypochondriacus]
MILTRTSKHYKNLTKTTEKAKMELSLLSQAGVSFPFTTTTVAGHKHIETTLTRAKFEDLCSHLLDRVIIKLMIGGA